MEQTTGEKSKIPDSQSKNNVDEKQSDVSNREANKDAEPPKDDKKPAEEPKGDEPAAVAASGLVYVSYIKYIMYVFDHHKTS